MRFGLVVGLGVGLWFAWGVFIDGWFFDSDAWGTVGEWVAGIATFAAVLLALTSADRSKGSERLRFIDSLTVGEVVELLEPSGSDGYAVCEVELHNRTGAHLFCVDVAINGAPADNLMAYWRFTSGGATFSSGCVVPNPGPVRRYEPTVNCFDGFGHRYERDRHGVWKVRLRRSWTRLPKDFNGPPAC